MVAIFLMILRVVLSIFLYAMLGLLAAIVGACAVALVVFFSSTPDIPLSVDPNELRHDLTPVMYLVWMAMQYDLTPVMYLVWMAMQSVTYFWLYMLIAFFVLTLFYNNSRKVRLKVPFFSIYFAVTFGIAVFAICSFFSHYDLINPYAVLIVAPVIGLIGLLFAILQFAAAFVAIRAVQFLRPCPKAQSPVAA